VILKADSITQAKDGYVWIATEEGLARFDGQLAGSGASVTRYRGMGEGGPMGQEKPSAG